METDAIISVAPCKECLDIYNDLRQVRKQKQTTIQILRYSEFLVLK